MTYYGSQFLYLSDVFGNPTELINGARTAQRLLRSEGWGGAGFSDVLSNAGCDALLLQPCTMDDDGTTEDWQMMDFTSEAAPWYTGSDASLEAYGFYIEEWTGMDGVHHGRSMTPLGRGGANFGPQSHGARVMKLNVLLLGKTERGLTHLFRWLESTLLGCCGCEDNSLWVREFCPTEPAIDPEEGLGRMTRIALLEGPTWEAPISERSGCTIRRASFALGVGDPCIYGPASTCAARASLTAVAQPFITNTEVAEDGSYNPLNAAHNCTPSFAYGAIDYGALAPVVTITSAMKLNASTGLREALPDIRISAYANPSGGGFGPGGTMRKFGELIITGRGTSGLEIVADLAEGIVKYRDVTGSTFDGWTDGSRLIGRPIESHLKRWWSLRPCDYGVINVEPVYKSLWNTTEAAAATQLAYTVAIDVVHKWGCC